MLSRSVLLALAMMACGPGHGPPAPTVDTDSGTPSSSGTPTTSTVVTTAAALTQSGQVTCPNPEDRANLGPFERRTAQALTTDGKYLWAAGVIGADFNQDGYLDMFIPGQTSHQLWLTVPGPTFQEVEFENAADSWLTAIDLDFVVGGTAADLDGDGDSDLVLSRWERPNALLINNGDGSFSDHTGNAMLARAEKTQSASVGDLDGDGDLDAFFGSYGEKPDTYDDASMSPAEPAELYRYEGAGLWSDMSGNLDAAAHDGYTFSSGMYDLDGDHLPEILVANDFGKVRPSVILKNDGGFQFTTDASWHPNWEDMGMGVGDINGDLLPDVLLSSWRSVDVLTQVEVGGERVWAQAGGSLNLQADFDNRSQSYGWGADWADLDNDADLDAMVLFGHWDAYDGSLNPEFQYDAFFEQVSPGHFEQRGDEDLWNLNDGGPGRGFITIDLNNDGWLDILKRQPGENSLLYIARCGASSWTRVQLQAPGANTQAIGATVRVTLDGHTQIRWITAGSTGMYGGQPIEAHFGLGEAQIIDRLEVHWPDGAVSAFEDVAANQILVVERTGP